VKYLKEKYSFKFSEIAQLLNRDQRTIWTSYNAVASKVIEFKPVEDDIYLDLSIFNNRKYSILEIICNHLVGLGFSISQIASLLNKHRNTIWSAYSRYKKK